MKDLLKRHWPLAGIAIIVIMLGFYLFGSKTEVIEDPILTDTTPGKGLKLKDIRYTQNNPDEKVKWVLDAKEVEYSHDGFFFTFHDFILRLEPLDKPAIELKGDRGDYNKRSGEINLRGNLRGFTGNGYRILTDHIHYNMPKGFVTSAEPVKIIGPAFSISGNALFFDLGKDLLKVESGVTTSISQESSIS